MNCEKMKLLISVYIDGEATADEAADVERHIRDCGQCRARYERFARTDDLLSLARRSAISPFFETRLIESIAAKEAEPASIFDLIGIEKKLLLAFTACSFAVSVLVLNLSVAQEYSEMKSYVLGSSVYAAADVSLDNQNTEFSDVASYLLGSVEI